MSPKETGAVNPYDLLLQNLTGVGHSKPRKKTAYNLWAKTQSAVINAEVKNVIVQWGARPKDLVNIRCQVTRRLFMGLPEEERVHWEQQSVEEHAEAMKEWTRATTTPASNKPEDMQL